MTEWIELAKAFGVTAMLVCFFVWWAYQRDKAMSTRLKQVEDYQRDQLTQLTTNATEAVTRSAEAEARTSAVLQRVCEALERRPCIAGDMKGVT